MKILITAGPTRESIDPVRYLSNRSSGKMGYALAEAAAQAGHHALLISGPTSLDVPEGVDFLSVETAAEMHAAVANHLRKMDAAIFAAAVADYTPASPAQQKIKKADATLSLELVKTKDILGAARHEIGFTGILVGFAAETENLLANAQRKLKAKHCDLIVANDVSRSDIGFDSSNNEVTLVFPDHTEFFPRNLKQKLACHLVHWLEEKSQILAEKNP